MGLDVASLDFSEWINPKWMDLATTGQLRASTLICEPYEHFVIDDFLSPLGFSQLLAATEKSYAMANQSRMGLTKDRDINWRLFTEKSVLRFIYSRELNGLVAGLADEPVNLKQNFMPQITEFLPGSKGYSIHTDVDEEFDFVFLLYIKNEGYLSPSEGTLCVYRKNTDNRIEKVKEVEIKENRLVVFRVSKNSFHSVNDIGAAQSRSNLCIDWVLPQSERAKARAAASVAQGAEHGPAV